MRTFYAAFVKDRVHRNLPEAGELGLAVADTSNTETIISQTVVESVRPVSISSAVGDGNAGSSTRIIEETSGSHSLEGFNGVVQEWSAETLEITERDSSESIESNEVPVDLIGAGRGDVVHGVVGDLVSSDIPVGNHGVVGIVERSKVGHLWRATIGVFAVGEELINCVDSIGLNSIIAVEKSQMLVLMSNWF